MFVINDKRSSGYKSEIIELIFEDTSDKTILKEPIEIEVNSAYFGLEMKEVEVEI